MGQRKINFLRLSQGKQVCDVGATTPLSYTLYFFVQSCSHGIFYQGKVRQF